MSITQERSNKISENGFAVLMIIGIATLIVWQLPMGYTILYPLTVLGTWFHEMGHGLAALILGGDFHKIVLHESGGYASLTTTSDWLPSRIYWPLVAAAGPMAPPIVGAIFILMSRTVRGAQIALYILLGFMALSLLIWVRGWWGFIAVSALGAAIGAITYYIKPEHRQFFAKFIGVQAALATFLNWRYLFTYSVGDFYVNGSAASLSDTGYIQQALWLPYWFWGAAIALFSAWLIVASLRKAYNK